jgi:hypothetical protein
MACRCEDAIRINVSSFLASNIKNFVTLWRRMHKGLKVTENVQQLVCLIGYQSSCPHELKYSVVVMEIISESISNLHKMP